MTSLLEVREFKLLIRRDPDLLASLTANCLWKGSVFLCPSVLSVLCHAVTPFQQFVDGLSTEIYLIFSFLSFFPLPLSLKSMFLT